MKKLYTIVVLCMMSLALVAQTRNVTGTVVDAETGESLIGVSVLEVGTTNGKITDVDGNFTLKVADKAELQLSYVGYESLNLRANKADLGRITMKAETVTLQDVTITGQMAKQQQTPVAVSQINALQIEERLGGQEFPEVLKNTPGVHANGNGGGWGDSEIWMRGFDNGKSTAN